MTSHPDAGAVRPVLAADAVRAAAQACQFTLVGLARAAPLEGEALVRWLAEGHAAGMTWMFDRLEERLDPGKILTGARTVIALGIPYHRPREERGVVARYARGRDYHYTHRDRMKALRKRLLALDPTLETYACVDTGPVMEKVWAERAGLGWIGKNGLLIHRELGSWFTLSAMYVDREMDHYDEPHPNLCGECDLCLRGCPTRAFPSPGVVDAGRCIAYHTIENQELIPIGLRPRLKGHVFGCDVCQEVCPFNRRDLPPGDARQAPRPLGLMTAEQIAALTPAEYQELSAGTAMARAQYDGLRRNAVLALGASRHRPARALLARLAADDDDEIVREAAGWALGRLGPET